MPKVQIPKKSIALDMTAMCDVAFLLLTFFILTTKFKPNEAVVVEIPTSVSDTKLPESDVMTITVGSDGKIFFGMDGQFIRADLLDRIGQVKKISFTDQEKAQFGLQDMTGMPINQIKSYLAIEPVARQKVLQPGIPCDSLNNELVEWIINGRYANPKVRIAVKADKGTDYKVVKKVIESLQYHNINRFNLITGMEAKPQLN